MLVPVSGVACLRGRIFIRLLLVSPRQHDHCPRFVIIAWRHSTAGPLAHVLGIQLNNFAEADNASRYHRSIPGMQASRTWGRGHAPVHHFVLRYPNRYTIRTFSQLPACARHDTTLLLSSA
jgi:hypothetical protein